MIKSTTHHVYLGLGTNLGNREENMQRALQQLNLRVGPLKRVSSFIETEPWGFVSSNKFLNACCCCDTTLSPREVLKVTQQIERDLGRTRKSVNGVYHDRTIDIDILLYDNLHVSEPDLHIPHPHIQERDFVLKPLREIYITPDAHRKRVG
ncbi:MAG: 2-amino-4-hydroxy-6-hydroxymethyldihydropteridine diphosphokinase [Prevotella sp.]|jgi:2-amino-4-hydroxy-6-hydroxymethyldihydropteridine diphosphokinase